MNLMNQIEYLKNILNLDLFDDCTVPAGLDIERVKGSIIMRCGLLTPLFSEPTVQRMATQQFFSENQWNFNHLVKILSADYSPIENVFEDRTETELIGKNHSDSGNFSKSGNNSTATVTETTTATERKISAENVSSYSPDNQETGTRTGTETETETLSQSGTDSRSGNSSENRSTSMHRNGNIGITSSQQLINEEIDLINRLNPYRFIADLYEKELMIGLY